MTGLHDVVDERRALAREVEELTTRCDRLRETLAARARAEAGGEMGGVVDSLRLLERASEALHRAAESLAPTTLKVPSPRVADDRHEAVPGEPEDPLRASLLRWAEAAVAGDLAACAELARTWPDRYESVRDLVVQGTDALTDEQWEDALPLLRYLTHVLAPSGDDPVAQQRLALLHILVGRLELRRGQADAALAELRTARLVALDVAPCHAALSEYYLANGQLVHAQERALRAVDLAPHQPDGHVARARCLEADGEDPSEHYARAVEAAWSTGDPLRALSAALAPVPPRLLHAVAARALDAGDADLALRALDRPPSVSPAEDDDTRWRRLADQHGLRARALEQTGAPVDDRARALVDAGEFATSANDLEPAREHLHAALVLDPDHARARYLLADVLRTASGLPQPPYVDAELLAEALAEWDRAVALRPPRGAWEQRVRASIAESFSLLARGNGSRHAWEAVVHLEQALAHDPDDSWALRGMSRLCERLDLFSCGLHAIDRVLEAYPDDAWSREQRVLLLANAGRYDEALDALPRVQDRAWADAVRAAVLVNRGRTEDLPEAIAALESAVGGPAPQPWQRTHLVIAYRRAGRADAARSATQALWNSRESQLPFDRDDVVSFASALMDLGEYREALELLSTLADDTPGRARRLRKTAVCRLALGDDGAADDLYEGILSDRAVGEWETFLDDLDALEQQVAGTVRTEIEPIVARARALVDQRRSEPPSVPSAEEELRPVLAEPDTLPEPARSAALAGLARLAREAGDWAVAVDRTRELRSVGPDALADAGAVLLVRLLHERGDALLTAGDEEGAAEAYDLALDLPAEDTEPGTVAALHARRALAAGLRGAGPSADDALVAALEGLGSDPVSAGSALAGVVAPLLRTVGDYWVVVDGWSGTAGRPVPPHVRESLEVARRELGRALHRILDPGDPPVDPLPIRPLMIELGQALIPADTGPAWPLFAETVPRFRASVERELGLALPGVRVRPADDLRPDEYALLLGESIAATGHVEAAAGTDDFAGLRPVVEHLRRLVLRNIPVVFGVDQFEALLAAEYREGDGATVARLLEQLPDARSRLRCAGLLRRLLEDGVSIAGWATTILPAAAGALGIDDLDEAEDLVRAQLVHRLPGNRPDVARYRLPAGWEALLEAAPRARGEARGEQFPPAAGHDLLRHLATAVAEQGGPERCALVLASRLTRRRLRRLTRARLPGLVLLAGTETEAADALPALPMVAPESLREPVPAATASGRAED